MPAVADLAVHERAAAIGVKNDVSVVILDAAAAIQIEPIIGYRNP